MASLLNALTGVVRQDLEKNSHYMKAKKSLERGAEVAGTVEKVAAAGLIAGVVSTTLGVGYCASGDLNMGTGFISAGVPLSFFSYNYYTASENFRSAVRETPEELMILGAANKPVPINQIALRKCLLRGTIGFEPFLSFYMKILAERSASR